MYYITHQIFIFHLGLQWSSFAQFITRNRKSTEIFRKLVLCLQPLISFQLEHSVSSGGWVNAEHGEGLLDEWFKINKKLPFRGSRDSLQRLLQHRHYTLLIYILAPFNMVILVNFDQLTFPNPGLQIMQCFLLATYTRFLQVSPNQF